MKPPVPRPVNFIRFTFNNGKTFCSLKKDTVKAVVDLFESTHDIDKKNAYVIVDNNVVFMENVDSISWNLVEEDEHEGN
jgi:hypothetical protein